MRMGQGVSTGLGHGGITCVLQTQFSSFFLNVLNGSQSDYVIAIFGSHVTHNASI